MTSSLLAGGETQHKAEVEPALIKVEQNHFQIYAGSSIGMASVSTYRFGVDNVADLSLRLGADVIEYLGMEFRTAVGLNEGDRLSHDYSYGFYLKPYYPVDDAWNIYGLLGYAQSKVSYKNEPEEQGINDNETIQNGFSYGLGVEYALQENMGVYAEFLRYIDESETLPQGKYAVKVDTFSVGVLWHF
jgi:opacity protein-like surface antigen